MSAFPLNEVLLLLALMMPNWNHDNLYMFEPQGIGLPKVTVFTKVVEDEWLIETAYEKRTFQKKSVEQMLDKSYSRISEEFLMHQFTEIESGDEKYQFARLSSGDRGIHIKVNGNSTFDIYPKYSKYPLKMAMLKKDIPKVESHMKLYRLDNGNYPPKVKGNELLMSYYPELKDPWGRPYLYLCDDLCRIISTGEDCEIGGDGVDRDIVIFSTKQ